jgi:CheY-like chemotaxis protein
MSALPDILLVEDNKDDRDLFELALKQSDLLATVSFAPGVDDALRRLNRQGHHAHMDLPAVVVLDLSLPDLDGVALLRYLRRHFLPVKIPVVVLTGSHRERDRALCEALHVEDYLVKPEIFSDLVSFVASLYIYLPGGTERQATQRLFRRR